MPELKHGTPSAYKRMCRCDECVAAKRAKDRAFYERNKDRVKARTANYYAENREAMAAKNAEWRERNAETIREKARAYYEANTEQEKQRARDWNAANPGRVRANNQRWKDTNRDKVRASDREYAARRQLNDPEAVRANRRAWAKTEKGALANRLARHARRGAPTDAEWAPILLRDPCSYCGNAGGEIDHIRPLAQGGTGDWLNLTTACRSCNARKGDRTLIRHLVESGAR